MVDKISCNNIKQNICFKGGMTRVFQSSINFLDNDKIQLMSQFYKKGSGNIGHIPQDIIEILKNKNPSYISQDIKKLQNAFNNTARWLKKRNIEKAERLLSKKSKEIGLLSNEGYVKIQKLGEGLLGTGYKISFKNNNCGVINPLCLKLFDGWGARYSRTHGFGVELNSALFLKKAVPIDNSNFVKVHWGNINTRFIISDFVAQDKKVNKTINIEALGLYHNDISDKNALIEKNMTHSGVIYDYGGLRTLYPKMTNNKVIRHFYYKIISQSSKTARKEKIREIEKRLEKKDFKDKEKILEAISLSKKHSSFLYKPFIIFKEIMKAFFSCY